MRRCKAQMRDRSPGLVAVPPLQPPRGLELIKSSAKFYANGAGTSEADNSAFMSRACCSK